MIITTRKWYKKLRSLGNMINKCMKIDCEIKWSSYVHVSGEISSFDLLCFTYKANKAAEVAQWVEAFAPQAEGWVYESQPR